MKTHQPLRCSYTIEQSVPIQFRQIDDSNTLTFYRQNLDHSILTGLTLLPPGFSALGTPRKVDNRNQKERVRRIQKTCQHIVPRNERGNHAENATRTLERHIGSSVCSVAAIQVSDSQADKRDPDHHEQRAEGESGLEGQKPH